MTVMRAAASRALLLGLTITACSRPAPDPAPVPARAPATPAPVTQRPTTQPAPTPATPGEVMVDPRRVEAATENRAALRGATSLPTPPAVQREFRAAWVATVDNIDWPSRKDLTTAQQQQELIAILDRARDLRMNALVFQVRPAADAIYPSTLEPWSAYLTGAQGRSPFPAWDPLAFVVREAHARGIELHAWFNPYRARHPSDKSPLDPTHIASAQPSMVKRYGSYLWMDPGEPTVIEKSVAVIVDVVRRYDVDGVHIDDYFYPYKERDRSGSLIPFPDASSYGDYTAKGGALPLDDWRRANVDTFVRQMYDRVKAAKPWVKVGISPFGIWRPGYPADVRGFDSYAELYGDSRKWLREGWLDYASPQLYWPIAKDGQAYPSLLGWWAKENVKQRHMWPGNYTSRVGTAAAWTADEIVNQIDVTRRQGNTTGNVHFSMSVFMPRAGSAASRPERELLTTRLMRESYATPALVPASPWLNAAGTVLGAPVVREERDARTGATFLIATAPASQVARSWVISRWDGRTWTSDIQPANGNTLTLATSAPPNEGVGYWISWIDRVGVESPRTGWLRTSDNIVRAVTP
ncbi:MAG TPA: family 10 glycosylhydrolase [Gemmatimonadaceae bacterium]|nr:family 10 glycosylhydrolase [Gemmatimonadaceae bacterium]